LSATSYGLTAGSYQLAFDAQNGVWNRWRNNQQGTLLASAARTTTTIASNQTNYNAKGVQIIIHVTVAGTGQLSPIIQAISPVTGSNYSLEAFPVITASGSYILELYPYSATAPTGSIISKRVSGVIPRSWTLAMGHSDSSSWTYSVGYSLII
jgi:predicted metal-dependent phosphotriesterase family hydrolase